jgi:hypothetical protein
MDNFIKGQAIVGFPFEMIDRTTGAGITTGTVNGYITKDGGTQEALSMSPTHEGNGQWSVNISAAEMTADILGLLFTHVNGVSQHFTIKTIVEATAPTYVPATTDGQVTVDEFEWDYYGTISRATAYFTRRLNAGPWDDAYYNDRQSSLIMATRAIDKLNFGSDKASATQNLQFPRGDDTDVPVEIEYACYEIALVLLDGYDQDQEAQTIGVLTESYSGVRTTYDASHVSEHIRAGIPSIEAWNYLKPFLRDPRLLRVSRVS